MPFRRARTHPTGALLAAASVTLALGLTGCAGSGAAPQRWADELERIDGVAAASWQRTAPSSVSPTVYEGELTVEPDLTEAQARTIAAESCRDESDISSVAVGIDEPLLGDNIVRQSEISASGCIPAQALADFARVNAAMQRLLPAYTGEFVVLDRVEGTDPDGAADPTQAREPDHDPFDGAPGVLAGATTEVMLLDAIRELHSQFADAPFTFVGDTSDAGGTLTPHGKPITARLTPAAELDRVLPLAESALTLERGSIALTDSAVTVHISSTDALASPAVHEFVELGRELGVEARAILTPLEMAGGVAPTAAELAEQRRLVDALVAVPGGSAVTVNAARTSVLAHDDVGAAAAAQLLAAAPAYGREFQVGSVADPESWVSMRSGGISAERATDVHAAALRARDEIPGVDRTIATLSAESATLRVFLVGDPDRVPPTTDAGAIAAARAFLQPFSDDGTFDEIRVTGPGIDPEAELLP